MDNKVHPAPDDEPSQQPGQPGPSVGEEEAGSGAPGYDSAPPPPSNLNPPQQWASPPKQPGYPGPNVGGGYPNQQFPAQGFPNQGYPNHRYPNQGHPNQGGGYPNQQAPSVENNGDGVVTMQPGSAMAAPDPQVKRNRQFGDFCHMILAVSVTLLCGSFICGCMAICMSGYSLYVWDKDRKAAKKWGTCSYVFSLIALLTTLILIAVFLLIISR